jgi:hypothetical protein
MAMRIILALVTAMAAVPALAADMPVKATVNKNPFINYTGSGLYWFVGTFAESADINFGAGVASSRMSAFGSGGSAGVGYMYGLKTSWVAADIRVSYTNTAADVSCLQAAATCSFARNLSTEVRAKYGSDLTALSNLLPAIGLSGIFDVLPVVPLGAVPATAHPYVFTAARVSENKANLLAVGIEKWRTDFGLGAGIVQQVGAGKVIDLWAKCGVTPSDVTSGITTLRFGKTCMGGADFVF